MLTSISVQIENDPINGGIRIKSFPTSGSYNHLSSIVISRKEPDGLSFDEIFKIDVVNIGSLSFDLLDIVTRSGSKYTYSIDLMSSGNLMPVESGLFENIEFKFEGLFVGDFNQKYVAGTNFETDIKMNTNVEYVTTLSGRHPYRISNADTNYITGNSSGLFLRLTDDNKKFIPDYDHSFSNEVLYFLCNGSNKVLKTHDGQMWYVSIDANPSKIYSNFYGMNAIQFSWTEIDDLPTFGMLRMEGE